MSNTHLQKTRTPAFEHRLSIDNSKIDTHMQCMPLLLILKFWSKSSAFCSLWGKNMARRKRAPQRASSFHRQHQNSHKGISVDSEFLVKKERIMQWSDFIIQGRRGSGNSCVHTSYFVDGAALFQMKVASPPERLIRLMHLQCLCTASCF